MKKTVIVCLSVLLFIAFSGASGNTEVVKGRKILVVYYSRTGNTEKVAKDIAAGLNAVLEKIDDNQKRSGVFGFLSSGREAAAKKLIKILPSRNDPKKFDIVIIGTPVWAGEISSPVRAYVTEYKGSLSNVSCFATSGGDSQTMVPASIGQITGKQPLNFVGFSHKELLNREIYEQKLSAFIKAFNK
jgi:hypothetical protein